MRCVRRRRVSPVKRSTTEREQGRIADIEARIRAIDQREEAMQKMYHRILELVQSR
jgi:hypothetical protein